MPALMCLLPHRAMVWERQLQEAAAVVSSPRHLHVLGNDSFAHCSSPEALAVCPPGFPGRLPNGSKADGKQPYAQETWEQRGKSEKLPKLLATRSQDEPE